MWLQVGEYQLWVELKECSVYLEYGMFAFFNSALLLLMQLYSFIVCLLFIPTLDSFLHCTCLDSHSLTSVYADIFFLCLSMWIHLLSWVQISPIHQGHFRCVVYATKSLQLFFFFQLNVVFKSKKHLNLYISSLINAMQTNSCRTWPDVSCLFKNEQDIKTILWMRFPVPSNHPITWKLLVYWDVLWDVKSPNPHVLHIYSPLSLHLVICHGEK